jgi:pimeloyl-ACP methyl ester carboxylesterase
MIGVKSALVWLFASVFALSGCTTAPSLAERHRTAEQLASMEGWQERTIDAGPFQLAAWVPARVVQNHELTIYIEGDGLAWLSPETLSDDPTPLVPVALQLALAQPGGNRVYLARPCQYTGHAEACGRKYWGSARFSERVISAMNDAVSQLKTEFGASKLNLVGYSGGGALAALIGERRQDVARLITVAGNLSVKRWAAEQNLTPLSESLDPNDQRERLAPTEQWHFVGTADHVVPMALTEDFVRGLANSHLVPVEGFDHRCCWQQRWPALWQMTAH